jgi:hypothetical protein
LAVLVAFPFFDNEITELAALVGPTCLEHSDIAWYLKPHPDTPRHSIESRLDQLDGRALIVEGSLRDWLSKVDVVVTAGTGVAVEAAALGLPVVLNRSRTGLTYDPLAWFPGLAVHCQSSEVLGQFLTRVRSMAPQDFDVLSSRGREVLESMFAPVTEDALLQFLA